MTAALADLYPQHLKTLCERSDAALQAGGLDSLVVAAGQPALRFLDDLHAPYAVHPHFKHWLPLTDAPGSWLLYTPGQRPRLVFLQPRDYWHVVPEAPDGYWTGFFDIVTIREPDQAREHLPADLSRCAVIGAADDLLDGRAPNNPQPVLDHLHYHRAYKTPYELELMRAANRRGARAHRAAEVAFGAGESEFGIHMAFLQAAGLTESELPYGSIVALNEHGAVLHYMHFDRQPPAAARSLLIDAGAAHCGYASDITRTHAAPDAEHFAALVADVDAVQRELCSMVRPGQDYRELHLLAHHRLAGVLKTHGVLRMSADGAVESGVSSAFFPHGLGHSIGLQVHDVGGFLASPDGTTVPRPQGHPFLRQTRRLEADMVCTIEPGLYFIDMLLDTLRQGAHAGDIDWNVVARLHPYGGIRIEDDVACHATGPENLTRDAFAALD